MPVDNLFIHRQLNANMREYSCAIYSLYMHLFFIVISLLMTLGTRPSGAGTTVQKHHSYGLDQLHPQLPQGKCVSVCVCVCVTMSKTVILLLFLFCLHFNVPRGTILVHFKCSNSCYSYLNVSREHKDVFVMWNIHTLSYLIWSLAQSHYLLCTFKFIGIFSVSMLKFDLSFIFQICFFYVLIFALYLM